MSIIDKSLNRVARHPSAKHAIDYNPPEPSRAQRKVARASTAHCSGHVVVSTADHRRVILVESHLEMTWLIYLLSLPNVLEISEQIGVEWVNDQGEVHTKYFDFLVTLTNGRRLACEVKPTVRLTSGRVVTELQTIAGQVIPRFADEVRLLTEAGLDRISLYNAEMFLGMQEIDVEADATAAGAVEEIRGAVRLADLVEAIGLSARGFRALVRLIRKGQLLLVRHERISPDAFVLLAEANQ